tara:strand:- start:829 stop:1263 length:435 start_codon:yes stop_codon:yes gene_type:complete
MNYQEKVLKHYDIELTENTFNGVCSLSVYKNLTSDGYDIWMINYDGGLDDNHEIDWEHDVYMYKDTIADVLFQQMKNRPCEEWYIDNIDEIFNDYHWADEWERIGGEVSIDDEIIDDDDKEPDVVEDMSGVELLLKLADGRHKN